MPWENEMCQCGLGGWFLLTTWARSSASDAGGVSDKVGCLSLSSPDSYYFFGNFYRKLGMGKQGNRWLVKVMSVMIQPRWKRGEGQLRPLLPIPIFLPHIDKWLRSVISYIMISA